MCISVSVHGGNNSHIQTGSWNEVPGTSGSRSVVTVCVTCTIKKYLETMGKMGIPGSISVNLSDGRSGMETSGRRMAGGGKQYPASVVGILVG